METTETVIRLLELVGTVAGPVQAEPIREDEPEWLKSFDPTAGDGLGFIDSTYNPYEAMRFPTMRDAIEYYRQETKHGKPLTAFTVEFTSLDLAVAIWQAKKGKRVNALVNDLTGHQG